MVPGARQPKTFGLGWRTQKTTTCEQSELERSPGELDTANDKSTSKSALVCAFMGHPHAACLWLKPAVPLSMSSPLSSDRSSKRESLEILTAWTHTGPKRKILKQGTPRNKYLCLKYLDYIPRNPQPLCSYSNSAGCASIMHPDSTRWMHFKGDASFGSRGYRPQSSWGVLGQRGWTWGPQRRFKAPDWRSISKTADLHVF